MPAVIEVNNLSRHFSGRSVLNQLQATAAEGDVIALLGKNGAGKTTLLETILGFAVPQHGEVRLFGTASTEIGAREKQQIGFVPQQDELLEQLTPYEQLELFARFQPNWDPKLADRLCSSWEIPLTTRINKLSLGQRQKLSIMLALCHNPRLLILDEPVASLDPLARRQFLTELVNIAADQQTTIIFSSHIVTDMERVANKVWLLKDQQLLWQGELDALKESVVRLHFSSTKALPATLHELKVLHQQQQTTQYTLTVTNWQPQWQASLEQLLATDIRVEYLNLEEIFLELHR
ncbi:ABC transporter ATP-binding protein [Alishewanella agri BL06]|uniref:ABC transporter ATP-binding protein n=1 Tax=Alishewanella agri BL06 TaxID=1195246 RepID=I9P0K4_9ALTE|nr:ABC transporter ATP-binding protein [Alishewanella agri]EIW88432.1 ABC transporter ATP-binding protein [Alishewanella agri BL06]